MVSDALREEMNRDLGFWVVAFWILLTPACIAAYAIVVAIWDMVAGLPGDDGRNISPADRVDALHDDPKENEPLRFR